MTKLLPLLPALCCLALLGCNKDEEAQPDTSINFGPGQGIFYRSALNEVIGSGDVTDWRTDITWQKRELDLFTFPVFVNLNQDTSGTGKRIHFYPNPVKETGGHATLDFTSTTAGKIKLVWVDKNYQVLQQDTATINKRKVFSVHLAPDVFAVGQTYRLYYVLYQPTGTLIFKGHGDVRID